MVAAELHGVLKKGPTAGSREAEQTEQAQQSKQSRLSKGI